MSFRRLRVAIGVLAVAIGATWAAGGAEALGDATLLLWRALPFAGAGAAVLLLARAAVPRGRLAGPLSLLAGCCAVIVFQLDATIRLPLNLVAPATLIIGGLLLAVGGRFAAESEASPEWIRTSVIWPSHSRLRGRAPVKLVLRSLLGDISVDLTACEYPLGEDDVTVDITMLGGHLHLLLPADWHVRVGRAHLAKGIRGHGSVSRSDPPGADEEIDKLVILNIQGFRGELRLSQPAPPAPPRRRRPAKRQPLSGPGRARSDNAP
ncbi:hypothetical protein ACTI_65050 [Actinoplanes sp. OR16]|uniref:hypothetical protein n=1 Tax=Actinoplanes sp. OR16 TaxID=946334 RepID=UPI000F70428C|nr:hypothetical protein [Actinoplanes sp. OR16]BBH69820.1 hypothetical protein ACTI_65050 [Actinoplanes sp. OR16]